MLSSASLATHRFEERDVVLAALLTLPTHIFADIFPLDHLVFYFVLEDDIQAAWIQIVELLERGRHKVLSLKVELLHFEGVFKNVEGLDGLLLRLVALLCQACYTLSHLLLSLDHFLRHVALLEVLRLNLRPYVVFFGLEVELLVNVRRP